MAELKCDACGRRFVFKPEYAGKTLKCKCGQSIKAPATAASLAPIRQTAMATAPAPNAPAAAAVSSGGGDDFSQLFGEAESEYAMAPEPPPSAKQKPPIARMAVATATGGAGPTSPLLGYARAVSKPPADDATKAAVITDLYVPIAMIIVGLVAYLFDARLRGAHSPLEASLFVFVSCALNLALVFGTLMVGVKVIGLGLGAVGPALLKIAAVGILPAAVGDLILWYTGISLPAWGVTLIMYYLLLYYLFDMDGGEIRLVTGIMWAVQFLLGMFVLGALMSGIGFSVAGKTMGPGGAHSLLSGPSEAGFVPDDEKMSPAEIDKFCDDAIADKSATEAHEWLHPNTPSHVGLGWSQSKMRELADRFVIRGAKKVWTSGVEKDNGDERCTRLIVELPQDPNKRNGCLSVRDNWEDRETGSTDSGQKYITVMIHENKPRR